MIDKFFFGLFGAIDCVFEWMHKNFKPNKNFEWMHKNFKPNKKCKCSICTCKGKK
jgi:hypothetical protein